MASPPSELRERVRRLPGMERLLPALDGLPPAYLVGGGVRDLLRGADPVDVDIAVEGDARSAARAVADRLGSGAREYERFGTATVETQEGTYNFVGTRRETYDAPGELPRVEPASLEEDLRRRDFSINAMALGLTGDDLGHLYDPCGGGADLDQGVVRVLHERSFLDDPTRLLRAVRYAARLGFELDPETERLAREAVAADALSTVSGARIRDELMDLLRETDSPSWIERMRDLEIHSALHPELDPDAELVASAALGAAAIGADRGIAALAALVENNPEELDLWLADLHLLADERDAASRAARVGPRIATTLRGREHSPSELRELLAREPLEALAVALAARAPSDPILRWVTELRGVGLEISGDDLLQAGVPEGPAIGRALDETLNMKLDGLVSDRDEELETALQLAREHAQ
jgi:tRNA nucleotidyltransferase (CCA-adding enzyme)